MAQVAAPKKPRTKRSPLWSIETLKEDLSRGASTLTNICKRYAEDQSKWRGLYADVRRWAKEDDELAALLEENQKKTDSKKRKVVKGGRKPKDLDPNHADWRVKYCAALLRTKSRNEAASATPYSPEEIYQRLNEKYSSYDAEFAELVHQTEMRLVAWAEEEIWMALEDAQHPKDRAWIAKEILKVRDRQRWGDKLDVSVQGQVTHRLIDRQKMLIELGSEQQKYFEKVESKALPAGEVMEAEVIE